MLRRVFQLIKIARKLSTSGAVNTINQLYNLPLVVNIFFNIISIGSETKTSNEDKQPGEKLCLFSKTTF